MGLAIGDALGGLFEGQSAERIRSRFTSADALINYPTKAIWYTDDTQMAIGLAESLVENGEVLEAHLCQSFVANYDPGRGYGFGACAVLDAMEQGRDYRQVAKDYFPGGSFGNGAAMRVAPLGAFFHDDLELLVKQARLSALPTHVHSLGVEGAELTALAAALAMRADVFDRSTYFDELLRRCKSEDYQHRLNEASQVNTFDELASLGNGIAAIESVPTAIACFAQNSESYADTIGSAILQGGDTDTIAAMAGAISGAHLGVDAIPKRLRELLEDSPKGRRYIVQLADKLFEAHRARTAAG